LFEMTVQKERIFEKTHPTHFSTPFFKSATLTFANVADR